MMWIYAVFIFLLSEAWSQEPGTNQSISVNSNTSPHINAVRNAAYNLDSDVNLTCSDKTLNEMIYVIWNMDLKYKRCKIAFSNDGQSEDSCNDGKSLRNTTRAQSYLHIPHFSNNDVGIYKCESVFKGGSENFQIDVAIIVSPTISAWKERTDNKMVAVCKAEKGNPAANISWSHTENSPTEEIKLESHGFFTVESRLELLEGMDKETLKCYIRHPYWREEKFLVPKLKEDYVPMLCIISVVVIVVFLAGFLYFAQKKLMLRRCQQSNTSPSKSAPREDVEEVEPYATYVQRVNSIYNSSADLFRSNAAHA